MADGRWLSYTYSVLARIESQAALISLCYNCAVGVMGKMCIGGSDESDMLAEELDR